MEILDELIDDLFHSGYMPHVLMFLTFLYFFWAAIQLYINNNKEKELDRLEKEIKSKMKSLEK